MPRIGEHITPRPEPRQPAVRSADEVGEQPALFADRVGRAGRVGRVYEEGTGVVGTITEFLARYIVLPPISLTVIATWVLASYLMDVWDRFPHLAINSAEKRSGKSTLLDLLFAITLNPIFTTNISCAALYRILQKELRTILFDEAQFLSRRASEHTEQLAEMLKAGISPSAKVLRVAGKDNSEIQEYPIYCPKIIALIGQLDPILADRCITASMRRKTKDEKVSRFRSKEVEAAGATVKKLIESWAAKNAERVSDIYNHTEPFSIENDRMAELLLPLQSVLIAAGDNASLSLLGEYAVSLEERDKDQESQSDGTLLLSALKEIFGNSEFIPTKQLIAALVDRSEEPWHRFNHGKEITDEKLAALLRPYKIKSARKQYQFTLGNKNVGSVTRGYYRADFEDAWSRYLPAQEGANP